MAEKASAKKLKGKTFMIKRKVTAKKVPRASTGTRTASKVLSDASEPRPKDLWNDEDAAFFQPYADKLKTAGF